MTDQTLVIGVFTQKEAAHKTIQALHQAGFQDDQLGFITRQQQDETDQHEEKTQRSANAVVRGVVGGILGAADIFLAPFTGPADANLILESTLPVAEEAFDRLPHPHAHAENTGVAVDTEASATVSAEQEEGTLPEQKNTNQYERTSILTGGVIGGAVGAIGAVAALLIPGIGPIVAGGIVAIVLGGAGMGGIAGGFLGAFVDIGVPEHKARFYEQEVKSGSTIVTIKAGKRQQEATQILQDHGAHDVQTHAS
jgi:hypothetical protein